MKRSLFMVVGLALTLSVGAQTTDEEKKPEKKGKAKTEEKAETVPQKSAQPNPPAKTHAHAQTTEHGATMQSHEAGQANEKTHATHTTAKNEQGGGVVRSTTVFKNGHQTSENISVRRTTRETTDVHFAIGTHPRDWWLRSYTIVSFSGCYYYQADNGYWYPAYGFDSGCSYPVGVVYISL